MTEETDPDLPEPFEYDPSFRGPVKSRSCTDLYCLYLFVIFVGAWIVLAGVGKLILLVLIMLMLV